MLETDCSARLLLLALVAATCLPGKSPADAGFRALLGNAYFAGGRFRSAEAAFKDSLSIYPNQAQVMLKLALVQTALGKKDQAVATLKEARSALGDSNYGLAMA